MSDPRQERTRQAAFEALDELLGEKPYDEISVTDVATRAGIGRQTFYRHFDSVNAIVEERIRLELAHQSALADQLPAEAGSAEWMRRLTQFAFERVAAQPRIAKIVLSGEAGAPAFKMFREQITALWARGSRDRLKDVSLVLQPYVATYHAGAIAAILLHWVEEGCIPDAERMSYFFADISAADPSALR